ncbi:MAG TPA: putative toxin-antitoxin system toxin component, PIN family [Flavisolibacter sp.]|nr:putative toxin-antitoxin system toxin component, PIN family [Flavisolibacter sp.]
MKVVIDCNVLVICLSSRSFYHPIYKALVAGQFTLAVTSDILLEYREILAQKYGELTAEAFIALLHELPNVQFLTTYYNWNLISADPDDNKYCDCAVAAQADYLVTEDKHFAVLKTISFPSIHTISIDAFAKVI